MPLWLLDVITPANVAFVTTYVKYIYLVWVKLQKYGYF